MIQQKGLVQQRTLASINTCYEQQITLASPASARQKCLPLSLLIFKVAFSSSANNTCILQYLTCNQEDKLRKSFRLSSQKKKIWLPNILAVFFFSPPVIWPQKLVCHPSHLSILEEACQNPLAVITNCQLSEAVHTLNRPLWSFIMRLQSLSCSKALSTYKTET